MASARSCGTASAKARERSETAPSRRSLPFSWARMCSCAAGSSESRASGGPVFHYRHGLALVDGGLSRATAFGVGRDRGLELVGEPQVVDDEAAWLVPEDPIHPGNRLHQPVGPHRLVQVHRVEGRGIEAREPHVADDDELEGIGWIAEAVGEELPALLAADVRLPLD